MLFMPGAAGVFYSAAGSANILTQTDNELSVSEITVRIILNKEFSGFRLECPEVVFC